MANPQKENGHTDIANEIMEEFCRLNMSKYEWRVLVAILRKTWGWHKTKDRISASQIAKITKIHIRHTQRTLKKLEKRRILRRDYRFLGTNVWGFNKNYEEWDTPIQGYPQTGVSPTPKQVQKTTPKQVYTKEKKETYRKKEELLKKLREDLIRKKILK